MAEGTEFTPDAFRAALERAIELGNQPHVHLVGPSGYCEFCGERFSTEQVEAAYGWRDWRNRRARRRSVHRR